MEFTVDRPAFIAEVAYALNRGASASVSLTAGSKYVAWSRDDLKQLEKRNPGIRVALHAVFNYDLADKVSNSTGERRDF